MRDQRPLAAIMDRQHRRLRIHAVPFGERIQVLAAWREETQRAWRAKTGPSVGSIVISRAASSEKWQPATTMICSGVRSMPMRVADPPSALDSPGTRHATSVRIDELRDGGQLRVCMSGREVARGIEATCFQQDVENALGCLGIRHPATLQFRMNAHGRIGDACVVGVEARARYGLPVEEQVGVAG